MESALYLDAHYYRSKELSTIIFQETECPLKPGFECTLSSRLTRPCICPKFQMRIEIHSFVHTDQGMHNRTTGAARFGVPPSACAAVSDLPPRTILANGANERTKTAGEHFNPDFEPVTFRELLKN
jgi:hypothetical protein